MGCPIGWPHRRSESRYRRPLAELTHWNAWDPARTGTEADVDHYVKDLRRKTMYRGTERMEDWSDHGCNADWEDDEGDPLRAEAERFADHPEDGT